MAAAFAADVSPAHRYVNSHPHVPSIASIVQNSSADKVDEPLVEYL